MVIVHMSLTTVTRLHVVIWLKLPWSCVRRVFSSLLLPSISGFSPYTPVSSCDNTGLMKGGPYCTSRENSLMYSWWSYPDISKDTLPFPLLLIYTVVNNQSLRQLIFFSFYSFTYIVLYMVIFKRCHCQKFPAEEAAVLPLIIFQWNYLSIDVNDFQGIWALLCASKWHLDKSINFHWQYTP